MRLLWQLVRTEGLRAVRDRWLDRRAGRKRRRSFRPLAAGESLPNMEILNVLPTPPRPDWGGVQVQLLRRLHAEAAHRPWALLFPDNDASGTFRLEVRDGGLRRAVKIEAAGPGAAIRDATERLGASIVHVEQSVGFPLDELAELAESDLKLVLSVHDFGLFCRRPHLIERPQMEFCHFSRDDERCRRCLSHDRQVEAEAQARWRASAQRLLDGASAVIYPSDYLRSTYADLFRLDAERQHVVAPPAVAEPVEAPPLHVPPLHSGRPRHLAYVGSVRAHKGASVLVELIETLRHRGQGQRRDDVRFTVYGGGDSEILRRLRSMPGVRVRGYYRAGTLPDLLRRDGVDLALLLSIWPETYALTLDECRLAGVPVVAFDHGGPAERIRAWGAGFLVDPAAGVGGVLEAMNRKRVLPAIMLEGAARFAGLADAKSAATRCLGIYRATVLGLE